MWRTQESTGFTTIYGMRRTKKAVFGWDHSPCDVDNFADKKGEV